MESWSWSIIFSILLSIAYPSYCSYLQHSYRKEAKIALVQVAVGVLMLAPFARLGPPPQGASTWLLLVTLGVVHTGLMYILLYGAVQKLPTYLQGALSFIYPVVAIGVDFVAFGHRLQPAQWLGAAAILLAAAAMNLQATRGGPAVPPAPAGIGNTRPR